MTCRLANILKTQCDVKKGDAVIVYMPTSPMAVAAMFACARIGAVHWYVKLCTCVYIHSVNAWSCYSNIICSSYSVLYSVLAAKDLEIRIKAGEKSHYL